MKNSYIVLAIILISLAIGFGIYFYNSKTKVSQNENTYNSAKLSTTENDSNTTNNTDNNTSQENTNSSENTTNNETNTNTENNATEETNTTQENTTPPPENTTNTETQPQPQPKETQISEFTTKIYTKEEDRQNNVSITCSTLNGTYVNQGETFSFCKTVGKATTAKGYEKADVFKDGEKIQALGGGNCQVSSTLYNAVLKVPGLDVTERHEHSNTVPYVPKGKDAAVSYRNL